MKEKKMGAVSIIGCTVGVVTCVVGVATFISALMTKSKQDGVLIAKIDQCVRGIEELKKDAKDKNHEIDKTLDEHTKDIASLKEQVKTLFERTK